MYVNAEGVDKNQPIRKRRFLLRASISQTKELDRNFKSMLCDDKEYHREYISRGSVVKDSESYSEYATYNTSL